MPFKIRTKLVIAFLAIIFPFITIFGAIALYNTNTILKASSKAEAISEELHLVLSLQLAIDKSLMPGNDYIITGDKKYIDEFDVASKDVEDLIKKVEEVLEAVRAGEGVKGGRGEFAKSPSRPLSPEVKKEMEIIKSVRIAWQNIKEISQKIFEIQNPVGNKEAARLMEEMDYQWAYPAIKMLDKHHEIDRKEHAEAIEKLQKAWMMAWVIMIGGAVFLITFGIFFALFYSRRFTRPIETIHNGADAIAGGNFKTRLDVKTGDEIEQLSKAMNEMAKQLDTLYLSMGEKIEEGIERFRAITESANDAIIVLKHPDIIHFWNKKAEEIFGYSADEILGKNVHGLIVPQKFREKAKGGLNNFFKTGQGPIIGKIVEVFGMRKDGTEFPVELSVSAVRIGGEWQAIGIIRDITERKMAEEAIKESEERFKRLVEYSPHGIAVHSEGKLLYINPMGASLLGASDAKELIGRSVMDFLHPDYKEIVTERIRKILEEGKEAPLSEEKFIQLDGSILDAEVSAVSVIYSGKQAVLVHFSDITERKRIQYSLKESEGRYRGIFENTTNAIVIFDSETWRFEDINKAAQNLYGYTREEFLLLTPLDVSAEAEKSRKALQDGVADKLTHVPLRYHKKKDGTVFPVEIFFGTLISEGRKKGFGVIVDLTEHKKSEEMLKHRLDELEEFRKVTIKRELRMEELKRKNKELEEELKIWKK